MATSATRSATNLARAADQPSKAEEQVILAGVSAMAAVAGRTQIHDASLETSPSQRRPLGVPWDRRSNRSIARGRSLPRLGPRGVRSKPVQRSSDRIGVRRWFSAECACKFAMLDHERTLALIELCDGAHRWGDQAQSSNDPAGRDLDADV